VTVAAALVVAEFVIRVIVELSTNQVLAWNGGFVNGQQLVPEHEADGAAAFSHRELIWFRQDPTAAERLVSELPNATIAIFAIVGALLLRRLITRAEHGDPFGGRAVTEVRILAVLPMAFHLTYSATYRAALGFLTPSPFVVPQYDGLVLGAYGAAVVGVLLLVLAEIWKRGRQFGNETRGLV